MLECPVLTYKIIAFSSQRDTRTFGPSDLSGGVIGLFLTLRRYTEEITAPNNVVLNKTIEKKIHI